MLAHGQIPLHLVASHCTHTPGTWAKQPRMYAPAQHWA